jgi:hypothetical protein
MVLSQPDVDVAELLDGAATVTDVRVETVAGGD